jgi:hypothetical protein
MNLTTVERDLLLRGLFELTITYVDDNALRDAVETLAAKLGGFPDAMFFGAAVK